MDAAPAAAPRRLTSEQRRTQLVRAAMHVLATGGYEALSFDAVAQEAGVTRNLLYHYFPDGVVDLFRVAAEQAGQDLTGDWSTDPSMPLEERRARNFAAMAAHVGAPSDAWAVSRITGVSSDPVVVEIYARHRRRVVEAMAINALGTPRPTPIQWAALDAYLAFADSMLTSVRAEGLPLEDVVGVLVQTLEVAVRAAGEAAG